MSHSTMPTGSDAGLHARYHAAFEGGATLDAFLAGAEAHRELWHAMDARVPDLSLEASRLRDDVGDCWRVLILADDWCGDAVNTVPLLTRYLESGGVARVRIVSREAHPELMDRHLTGGSRSIPMVLLLDAGGQVQGAWGPRPAELQRRVLGPLRALSPTERYREVRRWYARDRGRSTLAEFESVLRAASARGGKGITPCGEDRAA